MKIDSTVIGRTECMRIKMNKSRQPPKKGILIKPTVRRAKTPNRQTLVVDTTRNRELEIWSDVEPDEWGELESVPTREEELAAEAPTTSSTSVPAPKRKRLSKLKVSF